MQLPHNYCGMSSEGNERVELWLDKKEVTLFSCSSFLLPPLCTEPERQKQREEQEYRASSAASLTQLQSFPRNLGKGQANPRVFSVCLIWKPSLLYTDSGYDGPCQGSDKSLTFSALVSLPKPNNEDWPLVWPSFSSIQCKTLPCYVSTALCCLPDSMRGPP